MCVPLSTACMNTSLCLALFQFYPLLSRDFVKTGYLHKTPPNRPVSSRVYVTIFVVRVFNMLCFRFRFQ